MTVRVISGLLTTPTRLSIGWAGGPAVGGTCIGLPRLDPAVTVGGFFLLPDGSLGFKVVHQKLGGRKRVAPVRRSRDHQDDIVPWPQPPEPMNNAHAQKTPASLGSQDMAF